ncbi:MAG: hypothetical protein P8Y70_14020 [Candidatus Lokiarchaeota archaeon]
MFVSRKSKWESSMFLMGLIMILGSYIIPYVYYGLSVFIYIYSYVLGIIILSYVTYEATSKGIRKLEGKNLWIGATSVIIGLTLVILRIVGWLVIFIPIISQSYVDDVIAIIMLLFGIYFIRKKPIETKDEV